VLVAPPSELLVVPSELLVVAPSELVVAPSEPLVVTPGSEVVLLSSEPQAASATASTINKISGKTSQIDVLFTLDLPHVVRFSLVSSYPRDAPAMREVALLLSFSQDPH
jgi:hypothetical protein